MTYFHRYTNKPSAPIVHIEVQPSGSATMTFKGFQFEGKVMDFKHPRDAEAHARYNGFETIQRVTHPQYFSNHGRCDYFSPSFRYNERCSKFQQGSNQ